VIGLRGTAGHGSLAEWGVAYDELPRPPSGGAVDHARSAIPVDAQHPVLRAALQHFRPWQSFVLSVSLLDCGRPVHVMLAHERMP
jgi:hypothetical protein